MCASKNFFQGRSHLSSLSVHHLGTLRSPGFIEPCSRGPERRKKLIPTISGNGLNPIAIIACRRFESEVDVTSTVAVLNFAGFNIVDSRILGLPVSDLIELKTSGVNSFSADIHFHMLNSRKCHLIPPARFLCSQ